MKFCPKCGSELLDDAVVCPNCGTSVDNQSGAVANSGKNKTLGTVAKVFMIIAIVGCILTALGAMLSLMGGVPEGTPAEEALLLKSMYIGQLVGGLLPLAWGIPMTIIVSRKLRNHERIGTGFKVCTLIFVSLIAGILLLCMNDNNA